MEINWVTYSFGAIFLVHYGLEMSLDLLQHRHLGQRKDKVPAHLEGKVDLETVRKAVQYNREKLRLGLVSNVVAALATWGLILLGFGLLDGFVLARGFGAISGGLVFLGLLALVGGAVGLPFELYGTFSIEERYGFNRQTLGGFFRDKAKELIISAILGGLLVVTVLALMQYGGTYWWIYAYVGVAGIQLLITWAYPVVIMPLFNKFTPVEAELASDVSGLARRVGFPLKGVMTMDGSRRSGHSNAFIVGLRGARRIVLFDTLLDKLERSELMGVLAHELGHFKLGHITKRLVVSLVMMFAVFGVLAAMRGQDVFYMGLGFERVSLHGALVVFTLLLSETLFPVNWFSHYWSRRNEYEADRFAVDAQSNSSPLSSALIKLTKENLSSPGSHRLYRSYHNSHPSLRFRLRAIESYAEKQGYLESLEVEPAVNPEAQKGVGEGQREGDGNGDGA